MRSKEGAALPLFPEPDLGRLRWSAERREGWRAELPELPAAKRHRYADAARALSKLRRRVAS